MQEKELNSLLISLIISYYNLALEEEYFGNLEEGFMHYENCIKLSL